MHSWSHLCPHSNKLLDHPTPGDTTCIPLKDAQQKNHKCKQNIYCYGIHKCEVRVCCKTQQLYNPVFSKQLSTTKYYGRQGSLETLLRNYLHCFDFHKLFPNERLRPLRLQLTNSIRVRSIPPRKANKHRLSPPYLRS